MGKGRKYKIREDEEEPCSVRVKLEIQCELTVLFHFVSDFIYLFIIERRREEEREGDKHLSLPHIHAPTGDQTRMYLACILTGNWTRDLSFCRTTPNQLSHVNQGRTYSFLRNMSSVSIERARSNDSSVAMSTWHPDLVSTYISY